ncbi:MAG: hypothetical protein ACYCSN_14970 [Acidobacteriaceae bacterium]
MDKENPDDETAPDLGDVEPEPNQPGDVSADLSEISQEINALLRDPVRVKKLTGVAVLILRTKPRLQRQYEPEDLLQDALTRLGIGKRAWAKNRLDFDRAVIGVMRSWADNLEKQKKRKDVPLVLESELSTATENGDPPKLEDLAGHSSGPLEALLAKEGDAQSAAQLACVRGTYGRDELPGRILDKLKEISFDTLLQLRLAVGAEEAEFRNAWKHILRTAGKLVPKE